MKKTLYLLFSATLFTALLLGCGKETQSSTQGGGLFKFKVTITPPLQSGKSDQLQITTTPIALIYQWFGLTSSTNLSLYESQEYSVSKGQNVSATFYLGNSDNACRQVTVVGLIDNKVFKTETLEMGVKSANPPIYCKDQNPTINFIIP